MNQTSCASVRVLFVVKLHLGSGGAIAKHGTRYATSTAAKPVGCMRRCTDHVPSAAPGSVLCSATIKCLLDGCARGKPQNGTAAVCCTVLQAAK